MKKFLITIIIVLALLLILAIQNSTQVPFYLFFQQTTIHAIVLIIVGILLGAVLGFLGVMPLIQNKNTRINELNKILNDIRDKHRDIVEAEEEKLLKNDPS
jgi:uncharacterized integral membrane protein